MYIYIYICVCINTDNANAEGEGDQHDPEPDVAPADDMQAVPIDIGDQPLPQGIYPPLPGHSFVSYQLFALIREANK